MTVLSPIPNASVINASKVKPGDLAIAGKQNENQSSYKQQQCSDAPSGAIGF